MGSGSTGTASPGRAVARHRHLDGGVRPPAGHQPDDLWCLGRAASPGTDRAARVRAGGCPRRHAALADGLRPRGRARPSLRRSASCGLVRCRGPGAVAMLSPGPAQQIFLATEPVDMRGGFDRLACRVQQAAGLDLNAGHLFAFLSKRRTHLKILTHDGSGLVDLDSAPQHRAWHQLANAGGEHDLVACRASAAQAPPGRRRRRTRPALRVDPRGEQRPRSADAGALPRGRAGAGPRLGGGAGPAIGLRRWRHRATVGPSRSPPSQKLVAYPPVPASLHGHRFPVSRSQQRPGPNDSARQQQAPLPAVDLEPGPHQR